MQRRMRFRAGRRALSYKSSSDAKVAMKSEAGNGNLTPRAQRHGGSRAGDEFPTGVDTRNARREWLVRIS